MEVDAIDHVNLCLPTDRIEDALAFYRDGLGFGVEDLAAYRDGDRPIFTFRLGETTVVHVRPLPPEEFDPPSGNGYNHVALRVDRPIEEVKDLLAAADIEVETEGDRLGATGVAPAVYVRDPFGYRIELKETTDASA